jgi:hypothetical protein
MEDLKLEERYVSLYQDIILKLGNHLGPVGFLSSFCLKFSFCLNLVRMALIAIRAFLPTPGEGAVGAMDLSSEQRKKLALKSQTWTCSDCGVTSETALPKPEEVDQTKDKELASQVAQMGFGVRSKSTDGTVVNEPPSLDDADSKKSVEVVPKEETKEDKPVENVVEQKQEITETQVREAPPQVTMNGVNDGAHSRNETAFSILTLSLIAAILAILIKKAWTVLLTIQSGKN